MAEAACRDINLICDLELKTFFDTQFCLLKGNRSFPFLRPLFVLVLWLECGCKLGKFSVEWFYLPYQATLKAKLNLLGLGSASRS